MPKRLFELKQFRGGIWSTPSERDIPETAAAYSLDVEQLNADGKITGRTGDVYFLESNGFSETGVPTETQYNVGNEALEL
tara:strand:- start:283 stop:522 length:240 start_codon:yes stop_codon:yes gene_type:complete